MDSAHERITMSKQSLMEALKKATRIAANTVEHLSNSNNLETDQDLNTAYDFANQTVVELSKASTILNEKPEMPVKVRAVSILWLDDEGYEQEEDFEIGDTKEVGSILVSQLTVKEIKVKIQCPYHQDCPYKHIPQPTCRDLMNFKFFECNQKE